jgi:hypothetical protein
VPWVDRRHEVTSETAHLDAERATGIAAARAEGHAAFTAVRAEGRAAVDSAIRGN